MCAAGGGKHPQAFGKAGVTEIKIHLLSSVLGMGKERVWRVGETKGKD